MHKDTHTHTHTHTHREVSVKFKWAQGAVAYSSTFPVSNHALVSCMTVISCLLSSPLFYFLTFNLNYRLDWVRRRPWRKEWLHIPVFLPGEPHGQRSLASYSLWGRKELDTTNTHTETWSYFAEKTEAIKTSASPTIRISAHMFNLPFCYWGWTFMSLFKAYSTCHSFVISPGTLLLSAASVVFLCDSSFPSKHTCHSILYFSRQKDLDEIPLSALIYSSASFRTNSLKSLYLPPPILLSPFSTVVTFCPRNSTETPLFEVTLNLLGAKCNAHISV